MKRICFVILFVTGACASLRDKKIDIPQEIVEKSQVIVIPSDEQKEEEILRITQVAVPVQPAHREKKSPEVKEKKKVSPGGTPPKKQPPKETQTVTTIKNPFKVGEKIVMELSYLGLSAARVEMETRPFVKVNDAKAFHFTGSVKTSSLMNLVYKVDDVIEVFVDYRYLVPLKLGIHLKESKQNVEQVVIYDHKNKKANFWKKRIDSNDKVTEVNRCDNIVPYSQDILSVFYFIRTWDLAVGKKMQMAVYDNGKNWDVTVEVLSEESLSTDIGKVDTYMLKPTLSLGGKVSTKGELFVWITKDERKIPVKFKSKVKIGSLSGNIAEYVVN